MELCASSDAAGHDRPGGIAKLYDLLMDVGFNSAAQKLRGNKAATVIAVKNLGRCFAHSRFGPLSCAHCDSTPATYPRPDEPRLGPPRFAS